MKKNIIILALMLICLASCKVTKGYEYTGDYDTTTITLRDTITLTKEVKTYEHDTTIIVKHDTLTITFVGQGGTYNTITGEATGVASVSKSENARHESGHVDLSLSRADSTSLHSADSTHAIGSEHIIETSERGGTSWWRWLLAGIGIGFGALVALKRLPWTKPFLIWI